MRATARREALVYEAGIEAQYVSLITDCVSVGPLTGIDFILEIDTFMISG